MANINLLPENMREKERREMTKQAKKPKVLTIELSKGQKNSSLQPPKPPKRSFWKALFGTKKRSVTTPIVPAPPKSFKSSIEVDLLKTSKQQKIKYSSPKPVKPKRSFWSFMGPAKSPIKAPNKPMPPRPVPPAQPSVDPKSIKRPVKIDIKSAQTVPAPKSMKPRISFWSRFIGLFNLSHKKRPVHNKVVASPSEIKQSEKKQVTGKFHMAPKSHKSGLDINLVPEELVLRKYKKTRQQMVNIILVILIPALLVTGVYFIIDLQQKVVEKNIDNLIQDQKNLLAYISGFKDIQENNIRLQDKLLIVSNMLGDHIYWSKFFSLLEKYTLDDVYYTEFTADTSGDFLLPAIAVVDANSRNNIQTQVSNSYRKAAEQMVLLEQAGEFVDKVSVNNLEVVSSDIAGIKGVKFELNISLTDNVFQK